ncbi:MAG: DUF3095 domain-containing protein [Pseudomonadota bacterium]
MTENWLSSIPDLTQFEEVLDPSRFVPLPADWFVGVSDVVGSTAAIEEGQYKSVNLAGAATIAAVTNALSGSPPLFAFGGDGAHFAVPPKDQTRAQEALAQTALWSEKELGLTLRVGMISVAAIRAAGLDLRVANWPVSSDLRYAMFSGGGLEWVDQQLKGGRLPALEARQNGLPNLTGLSCQWGPLPSKRGNIMSLIVKPGPDATSAEFAALTKRLLTMLEKFESANPVPDAGPDVKWPSSSLRLQSKVSANNDRGLKRTIKTTFFSFAAWAIFKIGIRLGSFDPKSYRQEIAVNTDFRKFDDGLYMTLDCLPECITELRSFLEAQRETGKICFGLHVQDEALMTCVVPSIHSKSHIHFVDGSSGGYASAARQLRDSAAST